MGHRPGWDRSAGAALDSDDAIALAAMVAHFGGDVGSLPICYGDQGALDRAALRTWGAERELIYVWEDIDPDELLEPGGRDPNFTPGPDTLVIDAPAMITDNPTGAAADDPAHPVQPLYLTQLIEDTIADAWGKDAREF